MTRYRVLRRFDGPGTEYVPVVSSTTELSEHALFLSLEEQGIRPDTIVYVGDGYWRFDEWGWQVLPADSPLVEGLYGKIVRFERETARA